MISSNSITITRRFAGRTIAAIAERVEATETWQLRFYEGDELLNADQDDDVWQAARALIEAAFIEGDDGRTDRDEPTGK